MPGSVTPFPLVQLEGPPRAVGLGHGQQLGERIAVSLDHYRERFGHKAGLSWDEVLQRAQTIGARLEEHSPELFQEIEGIAEGSQHPVAAIVALNARTVLLRTSTETPTSDDAECTTGAALPDATADRHVYIFGNWDQHQRCLENSALMEVRIPRRPALFMLTEAGILMRSGFNEHGVGITGNSLTSDHDTGASSGTPWPLIRRRVLWHSSVAAAVTEVVSATRTHSGNHVIADAGGHAVDLEVTPPEVFALDPDEDVIVHSNHFLSAEACARVRDLQKAGLPSSRLRKERVEFELRTQRGTITVEDIKAALRDHTGHPRSVCAHPAPPDGTGTTVASHITDLTARTITISSGPPCKNDYRTFRLT